MLFQEVRYSSPDQWRRFLEKGAIPPLEDSSRLPPYCLKLKRGQLTLEQVDFISRSVLRKDPGPTTLSQIDAFCSQLEARDIKVHECLSELSKEKSKAINEKVRQMLDFILHSLEKPDRENSKKEHEAAIRTYRSCYQEIAPQSKTLENDLRSERALLKKHKQDLERTVDFSWNHRIPRVIRKFENSRFSVIRTLCHVAKRIYQFVVTLLFPRKNAKHRSNKTVIEKCRKLSSTIPLKKKQIRSLKQQYENSRPLFDAIEVAKLYFEKKKDIGKHPPKNLSVIARKIGDKIQQTNQENFIKDPALQEVDRSLEKLRCLKNLVKGKLENKEKEVITYLAQIHLPYSMIDNRILEMIRIDPYLRKRPPVLEAHVRAQIRLWEGLAQSHFRRTYGQFRFLRAVGRLPNQKEFDRNIAPREAIQELERFLRMEVSVKTPLKLPKKHQLQTVRFDWSMPIPQAISIPEAPEDVDLLKIKTFYESIEHKIPASIDDDTDDDGGVIRTFAKDVFKEGFFRIVDNLAGGFLIKDNYQSPMPPEFQMKVCNLLKHFILWVENEQEKIRKKTDPIQKKKLQEELDTALVQIFYMAAWPRILPLQ